VSLVEWAEKIIGKIKIKQAIKITFENISENKRLIKIYEPKNF
jgi:tRNA A37 threonylcarbamoyladenosine biosynthesis protein TsaE